MTPDQPQPDLPLLARVQGSLQRVLTSTPLTTLRPPAAATWRAIKLAHAHALRPLLSGLVSAAFAFSVSAPFAAWALMLMWAHPRLTAAEVAEAVQAGPWAILTAWQLLIAVAFGLVSTFGRQRTAIALGLAFAALTTLRGLAAQPGAPAVRPAALSRFQGESDDAGATTPRSRQWIWGDRIAPPSL